MKRSGHFYPRPFSNLIGLCCLLLSLSGCALFQHEGSVTVATLPTEPGISYQFKTKLPRDVRYVKFNGFQNRIGGNQNLKIVVRISNLGKDAFLAKVAGGKTLLIPPGGSAPLYQGELSGLTDSFGSFLSLQGRRNCCEFKLEFSQPPKFAVGPEMKLFNSSPPM